MYGGLRQHLYMLPAVAVLAGLGAAALIRAWRARGAGWVHWAVPVALAAALLIPAFEQTRLFPYNYVYVNPLAGIGGVQGNWETELQYISAREAFRRAPARAELACPLVLGELTRNRLREVAASNQCRPYIEPFRDEVGDDASRRRDPGAIWAVGRQRAGQGPPPYCTPEDNVTRPLRGEELVMTYVLRCTGSNPVGPSRP
jgi:hypothetical protein